MTLPYKIEGSQAKPVYIVGGSAGNGGVDVEIESSSSDPVFINDTWAFGTTYATTVNQQQLITVPAGKIWQVLSIYVELTTTGTAGNRLVEIILQDNLGNTVGMIRTGVTQAASLTYRYMFAPGLADLTAVRDTTYVMTPIPPTWIIPAAFSILIRDNNGIATAADDFVVRVMYAEKSA